MPNVLSAPDELASKNLLFFHNELQAAKHVDRQWDAKFGVEGAKIGDTLRLRQQNNFTVRRGNAFTSQAIEEATRTLRIDTPIGVDFTLDNAELALTVDAFDERLGKPALRSLANDIDRWLLQLVRAAPNATGTYNTAPTALADFQAPLTRLREFGVPADIEDMLMIMGPGEDQTAVSVLSGFFESGPRLRVQYEKGEMKSALGVRWLRSQNIYAHTAGLLGGAAGAVVNLAGQTGATLNIDGVTAGQAPWAREGDMFTIAGVNAVNPITGVAKSFLRQFTITADANSNGSGEVALSIYPSIVTSGARQTVDAGPANDAVVTMFTTTASQIANQPMLMHRMFAALVIAPEPEIKGIHISKTKTAEDAPIGIRLACWWDGDTNQFKWRYDILAGRLAQNPDFACRLHTS